MTVDEYGQVHYSIKEIIEILYQRPDFDLSEIAIEKTENNKYNEHCEELLEEMQILSDHNALTENIEDFHQMRLNTWFMPDAYKRLDILEFCLDQCETAEERQRVNDEMMNQVPCDRPFIREQQSLQFRYVLERSFVFQFTRAVDRLGQAELEGVPVFPKTLHPVTLLT